VLKYGAIFYSLCLIRHVLLMSNGESIEKNLLLSEYWSETETHQHTTQLNKKKRQPFNPIFFLRVDPLAL